MQILIYYSFHLFLLKYFMTNFSLRTFLHFGENLDSFTKHRKFREKWTGRKIKCRLWRIKLDPKNFHSFFFLFQHPTLYKIILGNISFDFFFFHTVAIFLNTIINGLKDLWLWLLTLYNFFNIIFHCYTYFFVCVNFVFDAVQYQFKLVCITF